MRDWFRHVVYRALYVASPRLFARWHARYICWRIDRTYRKLDRALNSIDAAAGEELWRKLNPEQPS